MKLKPSVYEVATLEDFQPYYWDVKELHILCKRSGLALQGIKADLIQRISTFLETGKKSDSRETKRQPAAKKKDSDLGITRDTHVVNYNNDAATRAFFIQEIGPHFRFNAYLRKFSTGTHPHLTYGELVAGYLAAEEEKKRTPKQAIDKQFEYNQFQRDYFLHEPTPTRQQCVAAWQFVRSVAGPPTYAAWKQLSQKEST